ncbi:MAG: hypothetical protein IJH60_00535 [Eubacterium sp.]|nr:hypothetical protein [Eubacterium sp.]
MVSTCSLQRQAIQEKESEIIRTRGVLTIALLYSILITVFQALKDGKALTELKETGVTSWMILQYGIKNLLLLGEKAAVESRMQTTGYLRGISYYLAKVLVISFVGSLVVIPIIWLIRRIILFYRQRMVNLPALSATAISLALVVWFGEVIQSILPISRLEMIVQVQIATSLYAALNIKWELSSNIFKFF